MACQNNSGQMSLNDPSVQGESAEMQDWRCQRIPLWFLLCQEIAQLCFLLHPISPSTARSENLQLNNQKYNNYIINSYDLQIEPYTPLKHLEYHWRYQVIWNIWVDPTNCQRFIGSGNTKIIPISLIFLISTTLHIPRKENWSLCYWFTLDFCKKQIPF